MWLSNKLAFARLSGCSAQYTVNVPCDVHYAEEDLTLARDTPGRLGLPNLQEKQHNRKDVRQIAHKPEDIHDWVCAGLPVAHSGTDKTQLSKETRGSIACEFAHAHTCVRHQIEAAGAHTRWAELLPCTATLVIVTVHTTLASTHTASYSTYPKHTAGQQECRKR